MKKISIYFISTLMTLFATNVSAQNISIVNKSVKINDAVLQISFNIEADKGVIKSKEGVVLTPILKSASEIATLPSIVINGRNRNISYKREKNRDKIISPYSVIKRKRNEVTIVEYRATIPFETWMDGSDLILDRDLCSCRSNVEHISTYMVAQNISQPKPPVIIAAPNEKIAYEPPKKEHNVLTEIFYFEDNISKISSNYDNNNSNIEKISSIFMNKNATITAIEIEGSASPLGATNHNEQLSEQRATTVQSYIKKNANVPTQNIKLTWVGENWGLLSKLVSLTDIKNKEQIMSIINSNDSPYERKAKLIELGDGKPYNYIKTNLYPKLRQASCTIHYYITEGQQ